MNHDAKTLLKEYLSKLDIKQFKILYGIIVHYWVNYKCFISDQNFLNLWCELNYHCAEVDESFPDPYDDRELLKSFCQAHPYYFIDILSPELVINLFCRYLDDKLDVLLVTIANKLHTEGLIAAYEYINEAMCLEENVDELVAQAEKHVKMFS